MAMNFAEIQAKKMVDMQEQAEAQSQQQPSTTNNQINSDSKTS